MLKTLCASDPWNEFIEATMQHQQLRLRFDVAIDAAAPGGARFIEVRSLHFPVRRVECAGRVYLNSLAQNRQHLESSRGSEQDAQQIRSKPRP